MVEIPTAISVRALTSYWFLSPTGCHISTYSTKPNGYAQVGGPGPDGKRMNTFAHRAAWTLVYGQIPDGMTVDHMCKQKRCVNVHHLRLLSNIENARRNGGIDFPLGQCPSGHPLPLEARKTSNQACKRCMKEVARRWRERRKSV